LRQLQSNFFGLPDMKHFLQRLNLTPVRLVLALALIIFFFLLPSQLFDVSYSTVVTDKQGELLSAHIADDGQWRFSCGDSVPEKFKTCLLYFEDEYYYYHPGFNPVSMVRAMVQNIKAGKVLSGGSTLTMQTIRISGNRERTIINKLWEILLAYRLEFHYSKDEILGLYAAHAPFGGNVVGLEAASWRYFSRPSWQLSWAESATLAVLPNSPALIHPGRNREILKAKRDRLLAKMMENGVIDQTEYELSIEEPVVPNPSNLPQIAPHLLGFYLKNGKGQIHRTCLDGNLQKQVDALVDHHARMLAMNQIHNAAAIVIDNRYGEVIAYVGNTDSEGQAHGNHVDIIRSARSSGSILKPFLYAASMQDGIITPNGLLADVPTYYTDFSPQNYQRSFDGAVPASEALSRSLNIPAVRLLDDYGTERFLQYLRQMGLTTLPYPASHYGLSLILGGGETSLWDLTGAYSSMARMLNHYNENQHYYSSDLHAPLLQPVDTSNVMRGKSEKPFLLSAGSLWFTFQALTQVQRPEEEAGWEDFADSRRVSWKTGTSFGYRDGWAIGVTPQYTVGVWVGNASGEGRPGIMGGTTAGPIMFDIYRLLPSTSWFEMPYDDCYKAPVCKASGFLAGVNCKDADTVFVPQSSKPFNTCPYHRIVHLDKTGQYRVSSSCYSTSNMVHQSWFVLPPLMEWYYRNRNPYYQLLPPFMEGCNDADDMPMEFIYPRPNVALFLPKNFSGKTEKVLLRVAHRRPSARLFWYVDEMYCGETTTWHQLPVELSFGWHVLTIVDDNGNRLTRRVQCVNR
jgi:penicillin-binding protein 1C